MEQRKKRKINNNNSSSESTQSKGWCNAWIFLYFLFAIAATIIWSTIEKVLSTPNTPISFVLLHTHHFLLIRLIGVIDTSYTSHTLFWSIWSSTILKQYGLKYPKHEISVERNTKQKNCRRKLTRKKLPIEIRWIQRVYDCSKRSAFCSVSNTHSCVAGTRFCTFH